MSDAVRSTTLPEDAGGDARTLLIRAAADAVSKLKPGRRPSAAVHKVLERLVLTDPMLAEASSRFPGSAASAAERHLHAGSLIEDAIKKTSAAHAAALSQAGIPPAVLELLQSWVEVTVDARVVQRQIQLRSAISDAQEA